MKNKIVPIINNLILKLKNIPTTIDSKLVGLIPNPTIRKVFYYSMIGLISFILLILILGLLLAPLRNRADDLTVINKPKIVSPSQKPVQNLNTTQKKLMDIENKTKDIRFPESILTIPVIESKLEL